MDIKSRVAKNIREDAQAKFREASSWGFSEQGMALYAEAERLLRRAAEIEAEISKRDA
jgi:DNA-binding transcriptional LysR family regulator